MTNMGTLYIVATPIGNLKDITLRSLEILKKVDLIFCEDTRRTLKLLDHYKIEKSLESFFEHNEERKITDALTRIQQGKSIALLSDAGTPLISDPGYRLGSEAIKMGIRVEPVPGPSSILTAVAASGLPIDQFVVVGFLPQKEGKRENFLEKLKSEERTIVAFESPNRLVFSLSSMIKVLGDRQICVAREMTKIHEEFFRGKLSDSIEHFGKQSQVKGEITLVVGGKIS